MLWTNHPIWLMWWYGACTAFSIANYVSWVRYNKKEFGKDATDAYLAFVIITLIVYCLISAVCFFWAQFYSPSKAEDPKNEHARNRVHVGMFFIYFFSDTPLFFLDLWILYYYGWMKEIQGITFCLKWISWLLGSFFVWFIYMGRMTDFLHMKVYPGGSSRRIPPRIGQDGNRQMAAADFHGEADAGY